MLKKEDIRIRDPFILPDPEHGCYYMYGTTALVPDCLRTTNTLSVYRTEDLSAPMGEPFMLFRASDNPNVSTYKGKPNCYVTDGPFLYRENRKIKMIWSSFYQGRYLILEAKSDILKGPWKHFGSKFDFDGGHAMLFERLDGVRMISLHTPNKANFERPCFIKYD